VSILGLTLPALTFALSIDRVLNGLTRPFFGWVSDHIGRETTMFIAFGLEAVGIVALAKMGHDPFWFVILTGMAAVDTRALPLNKNRPYMAKYRTEIARLKLGTPAKMASEYSVAVRITPKKLRGF